MAAMLQTSVTYVPAVVLCGSSRRPGITGSGEHISVYNTC